MNFFNLLPALSLAGLLMFSAQTGLSAPTSEDRPNIVFILADDLGYGDLGSYGQKQIRTPQLDRMAAEGVRFTQFYSGSSVCAPARATFLMGQHTGHTKVRNNGGSYIRPGERTVADLLKKAGYRTALFGKWGFGKTDGSGGPEKHGFDETLSYMTHVDAHDYTPGHLWKNGEKLVLEPDTYTPDLFTSAALEFVSQKHDSPYFLYLSYTIPHAHNALGKKTGNGMEVPSDAPYSDRDWPQPQKNHAAMITRLDSQVGTLLDRLKETGQERNTIVFFTSDNGPHREGGAKPDFFDSNGVLKGIKRDLYEGGIRVPMIVWGSDKVKPGSVSEKISAFWDFVPTAAELAGTKPEGKTDGLSILSALKGQEGPEHKHLYWELRDGSALGSFRSLQQAVRMGKWKAIRRGKGTEVYDLSKDPGEEKNLAGEQPDVVARAEGLFKTARTVPEDEKTSKSKSGRKPRKGTKAAKAAAPKGSRQ